jgi:hypothetical protein
MIVVLNALLIGIGASVTPRTIFSLEQFNRQMQENLLG